MTEERRRTSDRVLDLLLEQQKDNHAENQKDIKELSGLVRQALGVNERHGFRLDLLEEWRKVHVDPSLKTFHDGVAQAKGAGKFAKFLYTAGGIVGGGVLYKIGAAFIAALPK